MTRTAMTRTTMTRTAMTRTAMTRTAMTRTAAALALGLAGLIPFAGPASAQTPPLLQNDMIEIEYNEPQSEKYKPIYRRLKDRKILEQLATFLSPLKLQGALVL